jgi:hypothetical protein
MSILSAFSRQHPVLGLADISRRTGLSSSTTHRLVNELTEWGALARTSDLQYRLGPLLLRLGAVALSGPAPSAKNGHDEDERWDGTTPVINRDGNKEHGTIARPGSSQVHVSSDGAAQG